MTDDETLSSHPFSHPRYKDNHSEDNNFRQNSKSRVRSRQKYSHKGRFLTEGFSSQESEQDSQLKMERVGVRGATGDLSGDSLKKRIKLEQQQALAVIDQTAQQAQQFLRKMRGKSDGK